MKTFHIYTNKLKDVNGETTEHITKYLFDKGCICSDTVDE